MKLWSFFKYNKIHEFCVLWTQEFDKMYPFHATGFFPYPMNI